MNTNLAKRNRNKNSLFLNELFNDFFSDDLFQLNLTEPTMSSPQYDIIEKDDKHIINFMLSGFNRDNISIDIEDNKLLIEGERKINEEIEYNYKGSFYGKFNKSFTLPKNIENSKIDASFNDGILSIEIPKKGETKVGKKTIKIN